MARKRQPRKLKLLKGTLQKCRDRPEPEYAPAGKAEPPDWLTNADALAEWRRGFALLSATRVLTEADLTVFAHYCALHGDIASGRRLGVKPTAAESTQYRLYAAEFGFTPATRSKAQPAGEGADANPFANLGRGKA